MSQHLAFPQHIRQPTRFLYAYLVPAQVKMSQCLAPPQHPYECCPTPFPLQTYPEMLREAFKVARNTRLTSNGVGPLYKDNAAAVGHQIPPE
eukprot:2647631-Rhodomonas_salina.1